MPKRTPSRNDESDFFQDDLQSRARHVRQNMTWHEQVMWAVLRDRQFSDYKFRRQVVLGNYIVDFVCFDARVIVELDGRGHLDEKEYDERRTRWLESQGFRVVRFWNHEISEDIMSVGKILRERLRESPHPPTPSPTRGEGEK